MNATRCALRQGAVPPMRRRVLRAVAAVAAVGALGAVPWPAQAADDKGYDGLGIAVKVEGFFFNPTLMRVTVVDVDPGSPAQAAGIVVGDEIVEVEGLKVVGTKARALEPHLTKRPGEATNLVLLRAGGERLAVRMVTVARPTR